MLPIKVDILLPSFVRWRETAASCCFPQKFLKDAAETDRCAQQSYTSETEERRERRKFVTPACVPCASRFLVDMNVSRLGYAISSNIMRADVNGSNITLRRRRLRKNERSRKLALSCRTSEVQTRRRPRTLNTCIPGTTGIPRIFPSHRESSISIPLV